MKQTFFYAIILAAVLITSCKKKDEDTNDTTTPTPTPVATIVIHQPVEGAMYALDSVVTINVDITAADFEMHGYDVYLINETVGDTVWTTGLHDHGESFHIDGTWTNNVTDHSDMMLKVVAEIDHDGNTTEKSVHFHCHPD